MDLSLKNYLAYQEQFSLGNLTTEGLHPKTQNLSEVLEKDLSEAIRILQEVDRDALGILKAKSAEIYELQQKLQDVLKNKGRIYLAGCGATGRLALSLERIYTQLFQKNSVIGFMAGGDYALIRAVESFEDNPEYGEQQLLELGFNSNDYLVAITEGGETSFVIGALNEASKRSKHGSSFVYCNPDRDLAHITRSQEVITNPLINKINLSVGEMAISGSTRMQATTVQFIAIGFALLYQHSSYADMQNDWNDFIDKLSALDFSFLQTFILKEAALYQAQGKVTYLSDSEHAITILTDTTERGPTFSLSSFESESEDELSLCYLAVKEAKNASNAWQSLLLRTPRGIAWPFIHRDISLSAIYCFDISEQAVLRRKQLLKKSHQEHKVFEISVKNKNIHLMWGKCIVNYELTRNDLLFQHLALKLLLNIHSTLIMGKLHRFDGNMMTYVRASNFKLIDRVARYSERLLRNEKVPFTHLEVVEEIFEQMKLDDGRPIVLKVVEALKKKTS